MNDAAVKRRAQELIDKGVNPEEAMAVAIAEQTLKDLSAEESETERGKELEHIIQQGKEAVDKLKDIHRELTEE